MKKLHILFALSALGLFGALHASQAVCKKSKASIRVVLCENQESEITQDVLHDLKRLCSEDVQELLPVDSEAIWLTELTAEGLRVLIDNMSALQEGEVGVGKLCESFFVSNKIHEYKELARAADYLGIKHVIQGAFAVLTNHLLELQQKDPVLLCELLRLPFAEKFTYNWRLSGNVEEAGQAGSKELDHLMCKHGTNLIIADSVGDQALAYASKYGQEELLDLLLDYGADLDASTELDEDSNFLFRPIMYASREGHVNIVRKLLEAGSLLEYDKVSSPTAITPLILAARNGHAEVVKLLLEKNNQLEKRHQTNLEDFDDYEDVHRRFTALCYAAFFGHTAIVQMLLDYGAQVLFVDKNYGFNVLLAALEGGIENGNGRSDGCVATVSLIIEHGLKKVRNVCDVATDHLQAVVSQETVLPLRQVNMQNIALISAAHQSFVHLINFKGRSSSTPGPDKTPLIAAVEGEYEELVKLLLSCGANIDEVDSLGETALIKAVRAGNEKIVELLLLCGAGVNDIPWIVDEIFRDVPLTLTIACEKGNRAIVEMLLKKGARSFSALKIAQENGHVEIVALLESQFSSHIQEKK